MSNQEIFIITRRIKLNIIGQTLEEKNDSWKRLRYLNEVIYKMANHIINHQNANLKIKERTVLKGEHGSLYAALKKELESTIHEFQFCSKEQRIEITNKRKTILKELKEIESKEKENISLIFGTSERNTTYQIISDLFPEVNSNIRTTLNSQINSVFSKDLQDILFGKKTIRSYKKGMPIPFQKNAILNLRKEGKDFIFNLFNDKKYRIDFKTYLGKDKSNNKAILERILDGTYQMADSSIQLKDKEIYLNLVVKLPVEKKELDENISVGVDLGINTPVYVACNDGIKRKAIGDRIEFQNKRSYIQKRRQELQKASTYIKGGKGRSKKLKALEKIKLKEKNFVTSYNHVLSAKVIDFSLECRAKTIHLEDLKGFGKEEKQAWVLRNWSYFQLQNMISQKALKYGINVIFIDPAYTSQTCPICKNVDKNQRLTQKTFKCNNSNCKDYGVEKHADYVGALNISNKKETKQTKDQEMALV